MGRVRLISPEEWLAALSGTRAELVVDEYCRGYRRVRRAGSDSVADQALDKHCMKMAVHGAEKLAVSGREYCLEPGCFLWIPPGAGLREHGGGSYACYHLRFEMLSGGQQVSPVADTVLLRDAWELLPYIKQLVAEADTTRWQGGHRLRSLMSLLCIGVFRLQVSTEEPEAELSEDQSQRLVQHFNAHAAERLTAADLAAVVRLSPDYFTRVFRATFGEPPRMWMVRQRMRLAAEKLKRTEDSIKEVAYGLGYDDVYLFSRQFRSIIGMSPRAFRRGNG